MLRYVGPKTYSTSRHLTDEEYDVLYDIAERYNTSYPVSGDWNTETIHEMNAISRELGISKYEAKRLMLDELGFTSDMF